MTTSNQQFKRRARLAYELGRALSGLKFQVWTVFIVLLATFANGLIVPPAHLVMLLMVGSLFCIWQGGGFALGVRHGFFLGSVGLLMPILSPLMAAVPHHSHVVLCISIGITASLFLSKVVLKGVLPSTNTVSYLFTCAAVTPITASLCCFSMGLGGSLGFTLGLALLPCSRAIGTKLAR